MPRSPTGYTPTITTAATPHSADTHQRPASPTSRVSTTRQWHRLGRSRPSYARTVVPTVRSTGAVRIDLSYCTEIGRSDVPVVAGSQLSDDTIWAAEELVLNHIPTQPTDLSAAVRRVLDEHDGPISWAGLGPMSNLAAVVADNPAFGERLVVTQQEEAAARFSPDSGQRNFASDPNAARSVRATGIAPWIVPADVTFQLVNSLSTDSLEMKNSERDHDPAREVVHDHLTQWFDDFAPFITLHALPTLASAIGMPYLTSISATIGLDEAGRIIPGDNPVHLVRTADYSRLRAWLLHRLESVRSNLDIHPAADHNN
ncbi:nucleoside hydrolase [Nocardia asteroides]